MKNQNRKNLIRARAIALRFASLASVSTVSTVSTLGAPIASASLPSLHSPSLPCVKSAHVWRKSAQDADKGEALPLGFTPSPVEPFSPLVSPDMAREVEPIAYAEALPEIGAHNLAHSINCMLLSLPWRA